MLFQSKETGDRIGGELLDIDLQDFFSRRIFRINVFCLLDETSNARISLILTMSFFMRNYGEEFLDLWPEVDFLRFCFMILALTL